MLELKDGFGRKIEYLRLSVTDRCDFRCFYCIPKGYKDFTQPETWLTLDELERLVRLFSELGVSKMRLTGGEPLIRRDLPEMVRRIGALPMLEDLSLSTNASRLAEHAATLKEAGARLIHDEPRVGVGGSRIAFVHPKSAHGVLLELTQKERSNEE